MIAPETTTPVWQPEIRDLARPKDARRFADLLEGPSLWQVHDTLDEQLRDLVASRLPHRELPAAVRDAAVRDLLCDTPTKEYGRWVHYPWSGRLVHTLPPEQFEELRLDRNRNKLTRAEQQLLARTTVGVVGLSVGNAIALTLAQEGVCGHLKLADFDQLSLSNVNRLRARIDEIGLPKAILAARQIYELNAFASVSVFPEGITAANCDEFFGGNRPLTVLVEECDSLQLKFSLREWARARRVPVLMGTSDRGRLDVERFDLEPNRPLFHGHLGTLDATELGHVGPEERVAMVVRILDANELSARAAASLLEVDRTLSTWPQLASEVALSAASVTAAVRRIGLGEMLPSGRVYIDLDALLGHSESCPAARTPTPMGAHARGVLSGDVPDLIRFVVEHAVLAPSPGNSQPWQFAFDGRTVWVSLDRQRAAASLDPRQNAALLALGAAVENMTIAAARAGHSTCIETFPRSAGADVVAALRFDARGADAESVLARTFPLLPTRVTNRRTGRHLPLHPEVALALQAAAGMYGGSLELIVAPPALQELGEIIGEADRIRFLCKLLHQHMVAELRWSPGEVLATRDGLDVATLELDAAQMTALQLLRRADVTSILREQNGGQAIAELSRDNARTASAIGLLTLGKDTPEDWLNGGRTLQAVWLEATASGLAFQPITALLYMLQVLQDAPESYTELQRCKLEQLRRRLHVLFPCSSSAPMTMLFRLTSAPEPTGRSLRRPIEAVLTGQAADALNR